MKVKTISIITALMMSFAAFADNSSKGIVLPTQNCEQNCIEVTQVGSSLSILHKGRDGAPVETLSVKLPLDALLLSVGSSANIEDETFSPMTGGGTSTTINHTYTTKTHIVVVVIVLIYDASGNLLSVQSSTYSVPINHEK